MQRIKMDTVFMNSENSKTPKLHVLIWKRTNKLYLTIGEKIIALSNLRIQGYFECILKKHGEDIDKPSVEIYVNKIENRVTFKIKNGYSLGYNLGITKI